MVPIILLLVAGECIRTGWYGIAAIAFFTALLTMRWLWLVLAFFAGRRLSQMMNGPKD